MNRVRTLTKASQDDAATAEGLSGLIEPRLGQRWQAEVAEVLATLVSLIDLRDSYTGSHGRRVAQHAKRTASYMGLDSAAVDTVVWAAILHDIGKIGIPDHVLLKKGPLTVEESELVRKHPELGWMALRNVAEFSAIGNLVLHHHERYDGNGYPGGLQGEDIPIGARIIAVADTYDALTTNRPYRSQLSEEKSLDIIRLSTGSAFDPTVVEAFMQSHCVALGQEDNIEMDPAITDLS